MKYVPFCMIVIQTLLLVLVAISRPDNMQLHELILTPILTSIVQSGPNGLKAATPLLALNSVRDFFRFLSRLRQTLKITFVCYMKRLSYDNNN